MTSGLRPRHPSARADLPHALRVLEFHRVLDVVARHASSGLGAERVRALRPADRAAVAREALAMADEMAAFLLRREGWSPGPIPDLRTALKRLRIADAVLEPEALRGMAVLLASSRRARRALREGDRSGRERLAGIAAELVREPALQERLERSFDEAGEVADGASPALRRVRRELRDRRAALVARLEAFASRLPERQRVADASVTVRNGRYCIPVRREGRSAVGGIVHDESGTRQTLFVEPPVAIEPMNRIRELELEEAREVRRILAALSDALRPLAGELGDSLERLADLDALAARARYALGHGGSVPELGEVERGAGKGGEDARGRYRVAAGRHPLLLESEEHAVPFDLELEDGETVLLVSGPNAGGKTVLLKAIGVLSAMAQSGIVPPMGPGSRLPVFGRFFAVIGDEQSIEASLSTFSAQLRNLREILAESDGRSLVLADEIGSSTDPAEGAALAAVALGRLSEQAALTVATTHLGDLKALAGENPRIVNASLRFDAEALRPTFALRRDRPGRSYALEIAARHGFPADLLEEARSRLSAGERALDRVLKDLEEREAALAKLEAELRKRQRDLERRAAEAAREEEALERRVRELERREKEAEREGRERAERYLLEARTRVEEAIQGLENRYAEAAAGRANANEPPTAASEARSAVEAWLRETRRRRPEPEPASRPHAELREGDTVRIGSLDREGELQELRGDRAVVAAGGVRLTVPAADLEPAGGPREAGSEPGERPLAAGGQRPELEPRPEVNLRGLRVDEVEGVLLSALDAAIYADLPRLRIIHGKGTGALRERVRQLLLQDPRVPGFRPGGRDEGGSGVTVVELAPDGAG